MSAPVDVKLNVLFAPLLINTSHSESVLVGSSAQLSCLFDGNPAPTVRWLYTDPLSKIAESIPLHSSSQMSSQYLSITNVTYKNEGDYHCEAQNKINGHHYTVRSSNILLDVFGEPQFLPISSQSQQLQLPASGQQQQVHANKASQFSATTRASQGSNTNISLAFCSDPAPNKVYWQFGSNRIEVR